MPLYLPVAMFAVEWHGICAKRESSQQSLVSYCCHLQSAIEPQCLPGIISWIGWLMKSLMYCAVTRTAMSLSTCISIAAVIRYYVRAVMVGFFKTTISQQSFLSKMWLCSLQEFWKKSDVLRTIVQGSVHYASKCGTTSITSAMLLANAM